MFWLWNVISLVDQQNDAPRIIAKQPRTIPAHRSERKQHKARWVVSGRRRTITHLHTGLRSQVRAHRAKDSASEFFFCCCYQSNAYPELTRANVRVVDHFILCFFGTDSIDCGVTACSCCNGPGCIRLGTATSFVVCLSLVAFVSGGIESYFRLAAHQAASELSFDPIVLDWLLVTAGVAQGLFALLVSYWGNRFHRISWLGGIFMLQAISLIVLIIPTLTHKWVWWAVSEPLREQWGWEYRVL